MSRALAYCWKEWRAQRGVLLGFCVLAFLSLGLGLSLAPQAWWSTKDLGVHAISSCVLAGVLGVVLIVTPALVRGEFTGKGDQFVQRLPGALWPAFGGKLLFLVLMTLLLPIGGLLLGELFVLAHGGDWTGLFVYPGHWNENAVFGWTQDLGLRATPYLWGSLAGLAAMPWIWAVGTWMPGGRMAHGATLLFGLLVAILVGAVLRQSPGLEYSLSIAPWFWALPPTGLVVAAISWGLGRRGGGHQRSTRFGVLACFALLAGPSAWLGGRVHDYHYPDLNALAKLEVEGLSPDGRFALAGGNTHVAFAKVPIRIDLRTGEAEQLGGIWTTGSNSLIRPCRSVHTGSQRHWLLRDVRAGGAWALDLSTGECTAIDYDTKTHRTALPPELERPALADARATLGLQAPGGLAVWFEGRELCCETADGSVERTSWNEQGTGLVRPRGHGFWWDDRLFDISGRQLDVRHHAEVWIVRDQLVTAPDHRRYGRQWQQGTIGGEARACEALANAQVFGLVDDDRLLCLGRGKRALGEDGGLFLYRPADGSVTDIASGVRLRTGRTYVEPRLQQGSSWLARDGRGRIWVRTSSLTGRGYAIREHFLVLDLVSQKVEREFTLPPQLDRWQFEVLDLLDGERILARLGATIVRLDTTTGATETLFPRP